MFGYFILPIVLFVVLLIQINSLKRRVNELETRITSAGLSASAQTVSTPPVAEQVVDSAESPVVAEKTPGPGSRFASWLKEDWMMKVGAGLVLLAFGWFLTYAFMNNWIGPVGRIMIGFGAAIGFLVFGFKRFSHSIVQGGVFVVLGSTLSLITAFCAHNLYHMFGAVPLLLIALISSAFATVAGVQFRRLELVVSSLILAYVAPLLAQGGSSKHGLFAYLLVVSVGTLWVVALSKWRILTFLSLAAVSIYSIPFVVNGGAREMMVWAYVFSGLFFAANITAMIRGTVESIFADIKTAFLNALFIVVWIMIGVGDIYQSLVVSACALAFLVASFVVFKVSKKSIPFFVYSGIAFVMIGIATALELSGPALTIGFTIESVVFVALSYFLTRDRLLAERVSLTVMIPAFFAFASVDSARWNSSIFHSDCLVLVLISIALFALGYFLMRQSRTETGKVSSVGRVWIAWGSFDTLILIWLVVHSLSSTEMVGNFVSLVIYTIIAIAVYFAGITHSDRTKKIAGGALLGFVCVHLLFVESVAMGSAQRIVTFFVIGMLLLGTAFITKRIEPHSQA